MLLSGRLQQTVNFNTEMGWHFRGVRGRQCRDLQPEVAFCTKTRGASPLSAIQLQAKTCHQRLHLQRPRVFLLALKLQVTPQISGKSI